MRLRPSMNKFSAHDTDIAEIEIARAFYAPMKCNLNRHPHLLLCCALFDLTRGGSQVLDHDLGGSRCSKGGLSRDAKCGKGRRVSVRGFRGEVSLLQMLGNWSSQHATPLGSGRSSKTRTSAGRIDWLIWQTSYNCSGSICLRQFQKLASRTRSFTD